ncbi:phosphoenolpyruvate carboxykinase (ATP) [Mesorhizobium sp. B2-5-13]|uniref:phosphoenolpyruvate carboxykinase (ATP) n=1 Tax=unclassified Mesorhizobium TaxID=325217 RepID=UPI0011289CE3|nr:MULTISPECIES: phosphoenolpyruvate carboxykinase (ATP) [unclassified Mesorhizobium]TPJ81931.1 phosphoenolpyruvate carboxykinase (ATP) [Mesorhizobium sp. B2-5-13]TPK45868.1 phosphoenolpyruvate carboxykinase (ATP) [Mesorhizobium sp. B2-5-5]
MPLTLTLVNRIEKLARVRRESTRAQLVMRACERGEAQLTNSGAVAVSTGPFTGRSPKDKYIVRDELTDPHVWWDNGAAMTLAAFDLLLTDMLEHVQGRELYLEQLGAGADPSLQANVDIVTETAWHALFIRNLLRPRSRSASINATILHLPSFVADPARHETRTGTVIALDMSRNVVLIGGTAYAGEIKKSVFSLVNFHAPLMGILPMHCSANMNAAGETSLFFGLSGTGKTTLSSDPKRALVGDDEHLWSDAGIANIEGGCYAKTAKLSSSAEPEIYTATHSFGAVLENVVIENGEPDYADLSQTENTRAAYPLSTLKGVVETGTAPTPNNVVFLTADAFGVLPPIASLSPDEAIRLFLLGYTARLAGTERGVSEPTATFSACFGAPFMSHHPQVYGKLLADRLDKSRARVWLINTGWIGGPYGVGTRIDIAATRRLVEAAVSGELIGTPMRRDPFFGFDIPLSVEGLAKRQLDPRANWPDATAYDIAAGKLATSFAETFGKLQLTKAA